jgi:hypothetical protein
LKTLFPLLVLFSLFHVFLFDDEEKKLKEVQGNCCGPFRIALFKLSVFSKNTILTFQEICKSRMQVAITSQTEEYYSFRN